MYRSYIVILIGLILTTIGYFSRPAEIGWFLLGFGAANVLLGIIDLNYRNPISSQKPELK